VDIHSWIFVFYGYPLQNVFAWISLLGYQCGYPDLVLVTEDWHPKIMDILVDIRGFLEIHAWVFYGFSEQGRIHELRYSGPQKS